MVRPVPTGYAAERNGRNVTAVVIFKVVCVRVCVCVCVRVRVRVRACEFVCVCAPYWDVCFQEKIIRNLRCFHVHKRKEKQGCQHGVNAMGPI